jgi:cytoskeletal protein CcmA (bactofilin family)
LSKTYDELKRAEYLRNSAGAGANASTVIGPGVTFKGDISGTEDLLLEGKFEGMIQLGGSALTVGAAGRIRADIVAREVVVYGEVIGNVSARDRIEIKREGSIVGDLNTQRIVIEDGANFRGSMEIVGVTNSPQAPPPSPPSVPPSGGEPPQGRAATAGT